MPIIGLPSDSAARPRQQLECERSTPTGRPSGDRGWFRTELRLRPQDGKPRYAVRSPTSSVAPALSRPPLLRGIGREKLRPLSARLAPQAVAFKSVPNRKKSQSGVQNRSG